jgi:AmmeMemoRadiSam system protein A
MSISDDIIYFFITFLLLPSWGFRVILYCQTENHFYIKNVEREVKSSMKNKIWYFLLTFVLILSIVEGEQASHQQTTQEKQKERAIMKEHRSGEWNPGLTDEERETLYNIAYDTLVWCVTGRKTPFSFSKYTITPKLKEKCATFVTFKNKGELRGCVGCLEAYEPMYLSVHTSARNAAQDSRFWMNPITYKEVPEIEIHVSLLSPRKRIKSIDEFKIGEHGIWMTKGGASAVFLPEVAVEQKWTKEETLSYLSMKAGLDKNAWRSGAEFMVFWSVVITKE